MTTVLHIIPILSTGGATRALIATSKYSARQGKFQHRVCSLLRGAPEAVALAKAAGLTVLEVPDRDTILREMAAADIVQVNWWNNPELQALLHADLPRMRLLVWYHVAGNGAPQIITPELVNFADLNIPTNPWTYRELPVFRDLPAAERERRVAMVIDAADFERVQGIKLRKHSHFNIGYIGSVDFVKMHRNFIPMSAAIQVPDVRFIVCGHGIEKQLMEQARQLGAAERFDFRGYVSEIKSVIESFDAYGYPLCEDTYASGELNLQEIMYAGVPPVVFPHGGLKGLVEHDKTGLVVHSEAEYREAIEHLYHQPKERARLGGAAREHARAHFGAENAARILNPLYARLMTNQKQQRLWGCRPDETILVQPISILDVVETPDSAAGARMFIESLGASGKDFLTSLISQDLPALWVADQAIANASMLLRSVSSGGILHYRDAHPNDGFLRLWSGLVLQQEGKFIEALLEFSKAIDFGCDHWRVGWYIAQAAEQAGERALAEQAASAVLQVVPGFAPAKKLLSLAVKMPPAAATAPPSLADCLQQAEAHFNQGALAGAAAALRQALVLDPNAADARIALGSVLYQQGDFAEAYEQFLATAKLRPANAALQVKLAASAIKLDRFTEFETALGLAFQFEPENLDALKLLAGLNFQTGRHADAAHTFHRILRQVPNDEESLLCLGKCFFETGDLESTQLVFEQVLKNNPGHTLAQENLAVVKRKLAESRTPLQPVPTVSSAKGSSDTAQNVAKPDRQEVGPAIIVTRPRPKISIVTPSFNQGQFLEECLDSILSQNYPNLEYIVMDGGSRDGSLEIIKKHAKHLAHWQSQPDGGQYHAIQAGFERSGGEIMFWLNSDDKLHPGSLDVVAEVFNQLPNVEWIMGRPTAWDEAGLPKELSPELPQWSREKYLAREFNKGFIQQESTFWRRSVWNKAGGCLDTQIKLAADFELWARFFRFARLQVVDAMLGGFRYHSAQKTATLMLEYEAEVEEIIGRETRLLECSTDKTLLPAPAPLDITTLNRAASRITPENFSYFTYSKRPHFGFFRDHDLALYGRRIDPAQCDLKVYQDLLVYTFIKDNIAPGSRILEVGGGDSRVLKALKHDYECWNLDKLEGVGNGLIAVDATGYRLVKDYLGNFSQELPKSYFDFVFSISVFEHLAQNHENFRRVCLDMDRVMKTGALSLHCMDVVQHQKVRANKVLAFIFENVRTANKPIPLGQVKMDLHAFYMSEEAYNHGWKHITKQSYQDFGRPLSYNLLWKKTGEPILEILKEGQAEPEPLVSVIVSTYAAEKFIRACLEDLEAQTVANKLEIIVIDSGSPQNERAIIEEFQQRYNNISYHRTERETLYAAWNRAIGLARGKYIANANCDDAHRPDAIEKLLAALEAHPEADLAYGDYYTTSVPNGSFASPSILRHVVHPSYHPATVMMYCVTGCHPMWRKTVFDKLGLFDPSYTAPGDYEFLFRFVQAGLRAVRVPQPLSLFFQNAEGLSWKSAAQTKKEGDRILGKYRSQMPIERLFKVDPSDAASVSKAWVTLGNLAMQHEVPWLTNFVQDSPYALFCYEQALKADSSNVAAAQNLIVTRMLQQHSSRDLGFLQHFSAKVVNALLRDIKRGQLQLAPAEMPPAVEPIEFGEQAVTRVVPSTAVLPLPWEEGRGEGEQTLSPRLSLSVRLMASFLNHKQQASDALNLALPLASRINLATLDQSEPYWYSFDVNLPDAVRAALLSSRCKFNFCLGGIGISHGAVDEMNRVRGVDYHIGRTMFEADRLPVDWVRVCNQMDELWVPSRFNAEVFANSGVERDKLVIIPDAVSPSEFDPTRHTPLPLPNRAAFNFLAVFEWCTRKGWDVLIASYLREFSVDDDVCLYLRTSLSQKSEAETRAAIEQQIREFTRSLNLGDKKLPRVEIITGEIPMADMPKLYRAADCVVAASRGEGWGRVAHEAMMMALPVIATNWGGHTHFMNAETAYPLEYELVTARNLELDQWQYHGQRWANPSEKHLRELLRHVQQNPDEARAKGAKARAHVETHFSSEAVAEQVVARLQIIEEKLTKPSCPPAKTRDAAVPQSAIRNRQSLNVALEGSFLDLGSLSHVNRELTRQLAKQPKVSLTCVSKNVVPPELAKHKLLVETARRLKYPAPKNSHVTIRHAWPPNWERPASGAWVLIQPWEFGVLPADWTLRLGIVDEVWVYSDYVRRVYVDSGVDPAKVKIVPLGIDPEKFKPGLQPLHLATAKSFKFLFVGGTIHRKGPDLLVKAYLESFTAADDVCLVIKDFGGQSAYAGQTFESQIRAAQAQPNAPEILYLNEDLAPEALPGLYAACDCLVHPYRGEGFGLPVLEAMACGLPVVVTGGGSTDDFATDEVAYRIPALKKEFGSTVSGLKLVRDGWLLEPDLPALAARLKWVVANRDEARTTGRAASEHVRREWTWECAAQIATQRLQELITRRGTKSGEASRRSSKPIILPPVAKIGHLGEARELFRQGKLVPAWNKTVTALNVRPFHPEAFLLLGEIAQTTGDSKQAKEFAEHARTLAPKWKPAQQFLKSPPAKAQVGVELPVLQLSLYMAQGTPRLTVCLITKNEERFLGQCLESVRDLAQQIVVVDTGSTDGTRDIAVRHGAELYSFDWCDDFSAARNAALERAIGDWVLILDADEELLPGQRDALLQAMQDKGAIAYRLPMIDEGREDQGVSYVPRLFRNAPGLFYVGLVHEQVFTSVEVRRAEWGLENKLGTLQLLHRGYTKEMVKSRDKIKRNLRLLQKALELMPGEANLLMNLGLELVRAGHLQGGLEQYDAAFGALSALPTEEVVPELRETLLTQFCTDLLTVKNYAEIGRVQRSPLAKAGGLTASLHWLFGLACIESKNFVEGAQQMRQCLAKRDKPALSPVNKNILKAGPSHCLALCLSALKQTEAADKAFRSALEADPKSTGVQFDYARFLADNGHEVEALKWIHQLSTADPSDAMIWQFGGHVALSKPDFLEFACDWTSEAVKFFPANRGIAQQRAQALLLSGQPDGALPLWKRFGAASNPSHHAALIICETLLNQPLQPVPAEMAGRVEQEFVTWYRRLLAANAGNVIDALNQRTEPLRRVVPAAVQMLEAARAEANAVPVQ